MTEYPAELYALTHTGNDGDLAFYQRRCQGARSLLELGCGAGRVLRGLSAPNRTLVGLDLHHGLLARARTRLSERAAQLVHGDMRTFALGRRFDRILIPHSGIYCLLEESDVRACLERVRQHLAPQGRLLLDAYAADAFHAESDPQDLADDALVYVGAITTAAGCRYDVLERSRWRPEAQWLESTYVYAPIDAGGPGDVIEASIPQRYLLREQLERLLRSSGFNVLARYGDFRGAPLEASSEFLVYEAELAETPA